MSKAMQDEPQQRAAARWLRAAAFGAVAFGLGTAIFAAYEQGSTIDEPFHLAYSRRLLSTGETERKSVLHFDSKTPVVIANVLARRAARSLSGGRDVEWLKLAERLPTVAWLGMLFGLTALLAARLGGSAAGALATLLVALDPNLIAHGSLVTVDVAYALATLATLAAAWRFAQGPGPAWGFVLGLALAFAFATKFSALLLLAGVALAVVQASRGERRGWGARLGRVAAGLSVTLLTFLFVTGASYRFQEMGRPLEQLGLRSRWLGGVAKIAPSLRLPLPAAFLSGLDTVVRMEGSKEFPAVIVLDRRHPTGVFYYFAVCWALKTPLALLLAQLAGLALLLRERALVRSGEVRFLAFNLALALVFFSFFFRMQIGYRFVLMCLPLVAVLAGVGLALGLNARRRALLGAAVLAFGVAEQLPYLGNPLSFTNLLVRPKHLAFRYLNDSNLDWGQNDDRIGGWLLQTGRQHVPVNPPNPLPGENVYQVSVLGGLGNAWVRKNLDPVAHFRHSHLLFRVSEAEFQRYLVENRSFAPDPRQAPACKAVARRPPGMDARVALEREAPTALVCFETLAAVEIAFESERGSALFGPLGRPRKLWDLVGPGQTAYLHLEPGLHAFGIDRGFGFTAHLHAPVAGLLWGVEPRAGLPSP